MLRGTENYSVPSDAHNCSTGNLVNVIPCHKMLTIFFFIESDVNIVIAAKLCGYVEACGPPEE